MEKVRTPMAAFCTKCGTPATGDTAFCTKCGAPLAANVAAAPAPSAYIPPQSSAPAEYTQTGAAYTQPATGYVQPGTVVAAPVKGGSALQMNLIIGAGF